MNIDIDYSALRFWFDVAQFLATLLLGVYVWQSTRHRVTNDKISTLEKELDKRHELQTIKCGNHLERTTIIETNLSSLPKASDISGLSGQITVLVGELGELKGRLNGINRAVDLLNQHHLNGGQ